MLLAEVQKVAAAAHASLWSIWGPIASLAIAAAALLVSLSLRATAKKALQLSEREEERRKARLDISLKDAVSWRPSDTPSRWIAVRVLAVNPTDGQGSLIEAELHVAYKTQAGSALVLRIPHSSPSAHLREGIEPFELPVPLPSNGAVDGWFAFQMDDALIGRGSIESYEVVVGDARGISQSVQPWGIKELSP
jgi:hypothetical protein